MVGPYLEKFKASLKLIAPGFSDFEYVAIFMNGFIKTQKWNNLSNTQKNKYLSTYNNLQCQKSCF